MASREWDQFVSNALILVTLVVAGYCAVLPYWLPSWRMASVHLTVALVLMVVSFTVATIYLTLRALWRFVNAHRG